jgi:hypothetical protein
MAVRVHYVFSIVFFVNMLNRMPRLMSLLLVSLFFVDTITQPHVDHFGYCICADKTSSFAG